MIERRPIKGFEQYMIDINGVVSRNGKVLKPNNRRSGIRYKLSTFGYQVSRYAHRLVVGTFTNAHSFNVSFKDGNKCNPALSNLIVDVKSTVTDDDFEIGGRSTISWDKVRNIRETVGRGIGLELERMERSRLCKKLAAEYGVSLPTIHSIARGDTWKR